MNSVLSASPGPPPVFTSHDCESQISGMAADYCPQLHGLWRSMGIDDNECTFLMYELYCHLQEIFVTTLREAEDGKAKLQDEIEEQLAVLPQLIRELDDQTAANELSAIDPAQGLRPRAQAIKAIYVRLSETKTLSAKFINDSLKELNTLYREIGVEPSQMLVETNTADMSMKKIQRIKNELERISKLKFAQIAQVNQFAKQTLELCKELDVTPDEFTLSLVKQDFHLSDVRDPTDSSSNISALFTYQSLLVCIQKRLDKLEEHKQKQRIACNTMMENINKLWQQLNIAAQHRQSFLAAITNQPLSDLTLRKYSKELQELEQMKLEQMSLLVENVRADISSLWEKLGFTQQQQLLFRPFYLTPSQYDEEFLQAHEIERDRLVVLYNQYKPILSLVEKRNEYRAALAEHEINSADPDRLVTRRANYLVLREEEKMRNMEKRGLPKVEAQLVERLEKWEAENHSKFLFHGERLIERLQSEIEEQKQVAAMKRKAAEEARMRGSKLNAERASVYGRKVESGVRGDAPSSAGKILTSSTRVNNNATPARPGTSSSVKHALVTSASANAALNHSSSSSASAPGGYRRPAPPLFESRIPQQQYHDPQMSPRSSPKSISRTTPARLVGGTSRIPRSANKENSSL